MGLVLLRAGAYAKAADHFRAALAVVPDDTNAQVGLAAALRGQGDAKNPQMYEDARQILEKVLARDPHAVSALYNLGVLYADFLKKPEQAHALFQRFLDDAPADHPARAEAQRYLASTKNGAPPDAPPAAPAPPAGGGKS
jgi:cytochrome c-type biogenesis protein CcmH/NrfG